MSVKKSKEYRFTIQDAEGTFRVVYLQAQHFREGSKDSVKVQITSDGLPIETAVFEDDVAHRRVKTQTELGG